MADSETEMSLEFSAAEMRAMAEEVIARCVDHIASVERQPSSGDVDAAALCRALREPIPEQGRALGPLLDHLFRDCIPRSFTTIGPGYLGYIPGGGLYTAALADFIADTTNRYTGIWQAAPVLVQLETNALDWLRDWMGFPETTRGLFTTGGSMATFNAILCARERHLGPDIRRGVLYASDQAHHSVLKSAKMAGVMPDRVRAIRSDDRYRLDVRALVQAIIADRRHGLTPFAVVSNAGTTNTGAVDPLDTVADVCAREGLWHHIDGAYGAFFICATSSAPCCTACRAPIRSRSIRTRACSFRTAPARCSCGRAPPSGQRTRPRLPTFRRCRLRRTSTIPVNTDPSCRAPFPGCASGSR